MGAVLSDASLFAGGIYPEAYYKKVARPPWHSTRRHRPLQTGQVGQGQYVRLAKNPLYWDAAKYPMQHVEFDYLPNDNTKLLKLEAGEWM